MNRYPQQTAEAWQATVSGANAPVAAVGHSESPPTAASSVRYFRNVRRRALYDQVHQLHQLGKSQRAIARELEMDRETVQR